VSAYTAEVRISPRMGLLDPEGNAVEGALRSLGFNEVVHVRIGRLIRVQLEADSSAAARTQAEAMCKKLLANPVTEDFDIQLKDGH
jgi:phosphoribosylformylglycinamidine synthase PurS subunit